MGRTHLVAFGRRLMLSSDKRAAKEAADNAGKGYTPQIAMSGEIRTYTTPSGADIRVVYGLTWTKKPWTFTVSVCDADTGKPMGQEVGEAYEDPRNQPEAGFRRNGVIV